MIPTFLNAGLLGWLALASIPLIIYLINRRRYRRVPWAAMEFLLKAMRKNRRRLRLENLLLLILRTLLVLFVVLAFARPLLDADTLPVLGVQSRSEIYIIDRSYSMAVRDGSRSVLAQALTESRSRLRTLSKGDRVGLFLGGGFPERVYHEPQVITTEGTQPRVLEDLEEVEITYESFDVATTLQAVAAWVEAAGVGAPWVVYLYTDLQRRDWLGENGEADLAIRAAIDRLAELGVHLVVHALGPVKPRNASVVSLECDDSLLCVDLPTSFQVRIDNPGHDALAGFEVELWIDGAVQGSRKISLDPGQSRVLSFPYVFRETGLARVEAMLKTDDLEPDNRRYAVFAVRQAVRLLIVDGAGGLDDEYEQIRHLLPAIGADLSTHSAGERLTPFTCEVIHPDRLVGMMLEEFDVLVLADVGTLTEGDSRIIEAYLRGGGGVLTFLGSRVQGDVYRAAAWRNGDGWFPFAPGAVVEDRREEIVYSLKVAQSGHPAVRYLATTPEAGLSLVRVNGYHHVDSAVPENHVLLRVDDYADTPFLVERPFGNGSVLVFNSTADRRWNNMPITPAYVCFMQEVLPYLAARSDTVRNLHVNEPFTEVIPNRDYSQRLYLFRPDSSSQPVVLEERDDSSFLLELPAQPLPGLYEVRFGSRARGEAADEGSGRTEWFCVNLDPAEGILRRVEPDELQEAYGSEALSFRLLETAGADPAAGLRGSTGEMWRALMWAVLLLLLAESFLARWFGTQHPAGTAARTR